MASSMLRSYTLTDFLGQNPGTGIDAQHGFQIARRTVTAIADITIKRLAHHARDIKEANTPVQEGLHGNLISSVKNGGRQPATAHGTDSGIERRETVMRRILKHQTAQSRQIQAPRRRRNATWPA